MLSVATALHVDEIRKLDFSQLVALVDEPNMPSGGHETIRKILSELPSQKLNRVLDVGCTTGFASIELASWLTGAVTGVDINSTAIQRGRARADGLGVANVSFVVGDLLNLPFENASFDCVYCNNVTSFVSNKTRAIGEYCRVLKDGGFLVVVPIYYRENPPQEILVEVSDAIGVAVQNRGVDYWKSLFGYPELNLLYEQRYQYERLSSEAIADYVGRVVNAKRTPWLSPHQMEAAASRLKEFYSLFDRNLKFCGFSILIYRWRPENSFPILHSAKPLDDRCRETSL